ncbi:hypothetical protein D9M70_633160 [compost metagenome]
MRRIGLQGLFGLLQGSTVLGEGVAEQVASFGEGFVLVLHVVEHLRAPAGAFLHGSNGDQSRMAQGGEGVDRHQCAADAFHGASGIADSEPAGGADEGQARDEAERQKIQLHANAEVTHRKILLC